MTSSFVNNFFGSGTASTNDSTFHLISVEELHNREDNREINFDKVKEISESIKTDGLGQPILIRRSPRGGFEVIAGQHRVEAFRLLSETDPEKYSKIPAIEKIADDKTARRLMLATNVVNNALTPEDRRNALLELFSEAKELRKESKDEFKGKKTSAIVAEMLEEETGVKVSQATVERDLAKAKAKNTIIEDKKSFVKKNLSESWQTPELNAIEYKNSTLKAVSNLSEEDQELIATGVFGKNPSSIKEMEKMTKTATSIVGKGLDSICVQVEKSLESYFTNLEFAKYLGIDVTDALVGIKNYVIERCITLGGDTFADDWS